MAKSKFLVTITREDGSKVHLRPGGRGERDFVADVLNRVDIKGVGMFVSEERVKTIVHNAVWQALNDALHDLKKEVLPV